MKTEEKRAQNSAETARSVHWTDRLPCAPAPAENCAPQGCCEACSEELTEAQAKALGLG